MYLWMPPVFALLLTVAAAAAATRIIVGFHGVDDFLVFRHAAFCRNPALEPLTYKSVGFYRRQDEESALDDGQL